MEIRKFIFTIASKFDPKGFKAAEDAAKRLGTLAAGVTKGVGAIAKAHDRVSRSAKISAEKQAKAAKKTEADFLKAVDKQLKAVDRAAEKRDRAAQKAAQAESRQAAKAAAAAKREADKAAKDRKRAIERSVAAEKRAIERLVAANKRLRSTELQNDLRNYKRRVAAAEKAAAQEAAARNKRIAGAKQIGSDLMGVGRSFAGSAAAGAAGVTGLGAAVISKGIEFESLRARLKTVEGSAEGASRAFAKIQKFTAATPYDLQQVTTAYIQLQSLGLESSEEAMTAFGNVAAAQGKDMLEFIGAVSGATMGEFERLKSFGIKAKVDGDKVAFTFGGLTKKIGNNAEEIQAYLKGLGETEFAGAMAEQMATASGVVSNVKDTISAFFDEVAQMGVLDEFKGLLLDLVSVGGDEGGFAEVVAEMLVNGLQALRKAIQSVTAEDIKGFLHGARDAVKAMASMLGTAVDWLRKFIDWVGDTEEAIKLLTLGVMALIAAFNGPAGLVVAVGLVGVAIGRMVADAIADWTGLNDEIAKTDAEIKRVRAELDRIAKERKELEEREGDIVERIDASRKAAEDEAKAIIQQTGISALGAGLGKEADEHGVIGQAAAIRVARAGDKSALGALVTDEGKVVLEAVLKEEKRRGEAAVKRARKEAKKAGRDQEAAAQAALEAVTASNLASREAAFEAATATFAETGSAMKAAKAATTKVGKVKGAAKESKGKAGKQFFDFEKQAKTAAQTQAEDFAGRELQRLVSEGITGKEAIRMAQDAGKKRAKELEQRFLEAGRIFDASANNILDILGLRGPGSVLEGRPPPQTLLITIAPVFKFIETFNQSIESVAGAKALSEVTGKAGQTATEQGFEMSYERFQEMFMAMLSLQTQRLLKADGGGRMPPGPQG